MRIDNDVLEVLSLAQIDGTGVKLTGQLDRKMYTKVNKVLEAAGAKWDRYRCMHTFEASPWAAEARLEQALLTGQITTRQETDFFETPMPVIQKMMAAADIDAKHDVLEPSAGAGAIAAVVMGVPHRRLVCVERSADRVDLLRIRLGERGVMPAANFLDLTPADIGSFDRVVMNPPFSRQQDIAHIRHAYQFLKPQGRIVAVASAGVMFRQDRKTNDFRDWLNSCGDFDIHRLPEGAFKPSGTMVSTVMITIDKG